MNVNQEKGEFVSHLGAFFTQKQYQHILNLLSNFGGDNSGTSSTHVVVADAGSPVKVYFSKYEDQE